MNRLLLIFLSVLMVLSVTACGSSSEQETAVESPPAAGNAPAEDVVPEPAATLSAAEHVARGNGFGEAGETEAAIAEFLAALDMEPANAEAHAGLGMAYIDQGLYPDAMTEFEAALAVDPGNETAIGGMCVANAFVQLEAALDQCTAALAAHPENADLHNGLGVAYAQTRQYDEAITAFGQAIFIEPEHEWAHNNLGYTYVLIGRYDEAAAELVEAVRVAPENALAFYNLGLAYEYLGDLENAVPAFEEAIRLQPEMDSAYFDLGTIYSELGMQAEAQAAFEQYLVYAPQDSEMRDMVEATLAQWTAPADLLPGTYVLFEDALDYNSMDDDMDYFLLFYSPGEMYGSEGIISINIRPESGLDVAIDLLDVTTGSTVFIQEADAAGPGGEELLTYTLPDNDFATAVFALSIIAADGSGAYQASFAGSPAVGFALGEGWEATGVLGEQMQVYFVINGSENPGATVYVDAIPLQGQSIDIAVTAIDMAGYVNLGVLDDGGIGEAESSSLHLDNTAYVLGVSEAQGNPGTIIFTYNE